VLVTWLGACRFGDFTPDAAVIDAGPIDARVDAARIDGAVDATIADAAPDATVFDAAPADAYSGMHPIGGLGAGLTTLVGFSGPGIFDGTREASLFRNPVNVEVGPSGDIYVADFGNDAIRVVTPEGVTTTLTRQAGFFRPFGMTFTPAGVFYVQTDRSSLDQETGALWRVALDTGVPTLVQDNVGRVRGLASLSDGRIVMADAEEHTVKLFDPGTGMVTTIAGVAGMADFVDGVGSAARFNRPLDVVVTSTDDLYVADYGNNRIRFVTLAGAVGTVAGNGVQASVDGNALSASFNNPSGLALQNDNTLYISEFSSGFIRKLSAGAITTVAGSTPGFADNADPLQGQLYVNEGIDIAVPFLYISDGNGGTEDLFHRVRRLQL
jgi:sugar lactone lactonase YvrE